MQGVNRSNCTKAARRTRAAFEQKVPRSTNRRGPSPSPVFMIDLEALVCYMGQQLWSCLYASDAVGDTYSGWIAPYKTVREPFYLTQLYSHHTPTNIRRRRNVHTNLAWLCGQAHYTTYYHNYIHIYMSGNQSPPPRRARLARPSAAPSVILGF